MISGVLVETGSTPLQKLNALLDVLQCNMFMLSTTTLLEPSLSMYRQVNGAPLLIPFSFQE